MTQYCIEAISDLPKFSRAMLSTEKTTANFATLLSTLSKNNTILLIHLKGVSRWFKATDNIIQRFNEIVVFYVFIMHVVLLGLNSTNIEESPVGVLAQQQNVNIFRTTRQLLNAFFVNIPWCHFITPKKKNWMNFCWEFICKIFMKMISLSRASYSLISSYNSKKDTVNVELKMKYKKFFN